MILFPAIDLKDGVCVRLEQGDMARATVFNRDPAAQAQSFEAEGFEYLHVVDLDGAFAGRPVNAAAVERILESVRMPVQLGGGIRDMATIEAWLEKGVDRVIIGTAAVRDPALVRRPRAHFPAASRSALDARDGKVAVEGWAETSELVRARASRAASRMPASPPSSTPTSRATALLEGLNLDATHRARRRDRDPGDRLGRPRLDRRHRGAAGAARDAGSPAPSPAARSTTAGSMPPRRCG